MKRFAKITALVLILVLVLGCLAACGRALSDEEKAAVGKYKMTAIYGMAYESEDSYLELNDDGTADLFVEGEGGAVKWSLENGDLTIEDDSNDTLSGTVEGDAINLMLGGTMATFER